MAPGSRAVAAAVPVVGAAAAFAVPLDLEPSGRRALAIATWMVLSWILEPLHPAVVGFAGCFLFVLAGSAEFETAFGGFSTATPWFLYGALMLIAAAQASGAVATLATFVPRAVAASFPTASSALVGLALLTGFAIESATARGVIVVVAALAISARLDQLRRGAERQLGPIGTRLPLIAVASYAAAVLGGEAGDPQLSMVWRAAGAVVCLAIAAWFVRPAAELPVVPVPQPVPAGHGIMAVLMLAVILWATLPLHGVSAGVIGMGAGLAVAFPGLRPRRDAEVNPDPLALILAGTALSAPLVLEETKAASALTAALQSWSAGVGPGPVQGLAHFAANAVMSLFEPGAHEPAPKLALYQSPALILGAAVAGISTRNILKFGLALAVVGALAALIT